MRRESCREAGLGEPLDVATGSRHRGWRNPRTYRGKAEDLSEDAEPRAGLQGRKICTGGNGGGNLAHGDHPRLS